MIYLHRYTRQNDRYVVDIAVCEVDRNVAWYEARGFKCCTLEAFLASWRLRDTLAKDAIIRELRQALQTAPLGAPPSVGPPASIKLAAKSKGHEDTWR